VNAWQERFYNECAVLTRLPALRCAEGQWALRGMRHSPRYCPRGAIFAAAQRRAYLQEPTAGTSRLSSSNQLGTTLSRVLHPQSHQYQRAPSPGTSGRRR
jgi:hypothetical protein